MTWQDTPCFTWSGRLDRDGYARAGDELVHRRLYWFRFGVVPPELDHLCRNRACVNPDHLEPVSHAENMARSAAALRTHCVNGHPFDEQNTYRRPNGNRDCRACGAVRSMAYARRRKEQG